MPMAASILLTFLSVGCIGWLHIFFCRFHLFHVSIACLLQAPGGVRGRRLQPIHPGQVTAGGREHGAAAGAAQAIVVHGQRCHGRVGRRGEVGA